MKYSFTIIVKPYERKNCTCDDYRVIYNGKTCLVAKNAKHGELYIHPCAKIIKGNFSKIAGSINYPILFNKQDVHIRVTDFHSAPEIKTNQLVKQDIISVIDISTN